MSLTEVCVTVITVTGGAAKKAAAYECRWQQLWARYGKVDPNPKWSNFIEWLILIRPNLRPATWRQYRAAVVYVMNDRLVQDKNFFQSRLMERNNLPECKSLPARTSSSKSKSISDADMDKLIQYLSVHNGKWDSLTGQWLVFGMITGLRPGEWCDVKVCSHEDGMILRVVNKKFDGQRAHGPERTIHVHISAHMQDALNVFIQTIQSEAEDFSVVYEGCRIALWRATKILWPRRKKRIALYSARHQFAADAKSAGLDPKVIAALMGHAVTDTHQTQYGKRRSGRGQLMVEADNADVTRVFERMQHKNERQKERMVVKSRTQRLFE